MAAKKKTAARKPAKRAAAPAKAAAKARAAGSGAAGKKTARSAGRGGEGEVVYSDVLHELRKGLVSRLIRQQAGLRSVHIPECGAPRAEVLAQLERPMPWPHPPADFRERHRSVWIGIPSRLYDP